MSPEMARAIGFTLFIPAAGLNVFHFLYSRNIRQYVRTAYPELKGFGGTPLHKEKRRLAQQDSRLRRMLRIERWLGPIAYGSLAGAAALAQVDWFIF